MIPDEPVVINREEMEKFANDTKVWLMTPEGQILAKESLAEAMKMVGQIYEAAKLRPEDFCNPITL